MKIILTRIANEPAFIGGLFQLIVPALVIFGVVEWDGMQVASVTGIVGFLTGVGVRSQVSPASKPTQALPLLEVEVD